MLLEEVINSDLKKGDFVCIIAKENRPESSGYVRLNDFIIGIYMYVVKDEPVFWNGFHMSELVGHHDVVYVSSTANKINKAEWEYFKSRKLLNKEHYERTKLTIDEQHYELSDDLLDTPPHIGFVLEYIDKIIKLGSLQDLTKKEV